MPDTPFRFDATNEAAQRVAERQAALLVTAVSTETRAAVRALIVRAIREGIPPYDAARIIEQMVGLTDRQAMAAMNYREALINSGLTLDRVEALSTRYIQKKLRERATVIARTETLSALNNGIQEAWKQAKREGLLSSDAKKTWITSPDERLCPFCAPLEGQTVPVNERFQTGLGDVMQPPLHPQCRCSTGIVAA
jgi:SPP1 gp7 family putative phage head morphogenesis protein